MSSGQQLATDNFTRANENPLSDGGNWSAQTGLSALQVVSDLCEPTALITNCGAYYSGLSWPNDQYSEVQINNIAANLNDTVFVRVRTVAIFKNNSYQLNVATSSSGPNSILVYKWVSNALTLILTCSPTTITNGDIFRLVVAGTLLTVFRNGSSIGSVIDSDLSSGSPGIGLSATSFLTNADLSLWNGGSAVEPTPSFSPAGGTFSSPQTVTISCTDASATITYTTDGSTPIPGSHGTVYSGPITVNSSQTVKAVAAVTGYTNSLVGSAAYTISPASGGKNAGLYLAMDTSLRNSGIRH